jgi:hypothetical protein
LEIAKVVRIIGLLFSTVKAELCLEQKRVGLRFGRFFFSNASGHPDHYVPTFDEARQDAKNLSGETTSSRQT